jgi:hypothetical protein
VSRDDLVYLDPVHSQPDSGILVFHHVSGIRRLRLDDTYLVVKQESVHPLSDKPVLEKEYDHYRRVRGSWLPLQVRYSQGKPREWMEVFFDHITLQ